MRAGNYSKIWTELALRIRATLPMLVSKWSSWKMFPFSPSAHSFLISPLLYASNTRFISAAWIPANGENSVVAATSPQPAYKIFVYVLSAAIAYVVCDCVEGFIVNSASWIEFAHQRTLLNQLLWSSVTTAIIRSEAICSLLLSFQQKPNTERVPSKRVLHAINLIIIAAHKYFTVILYI